MRPKDVVRFSLNALLDRRLRTGLTVLMVVIGTTLIVTLNGVNAGFSVFINQQLSTLAPDVLVVTPTPFVGGSFQQSAKITLNQQALDKIERIRGVEFATAFYSGQVQITSAGASRTATVFGLDSTKISTLVPTALTEEGKFFPATDSAGILLGNSLAFPEGRTTSFAEVGRTVRLETTFVDVEGEVVEARRTFVVRGVLELTGTSFLDNGAWISPSAANAFLNKGSKFDGIQVAVVRPEIVEEVEAKIRTTFGGNIAVATPKAIGNTISNITGALNAFILAIAGVSLMVGAVGIITTLFTSVMERTREIGLMKALGFKNANVLLVFLTESIFIGIFGGLIGIGLGVGLSQIFSQTLFAARFSGFGGGASISPVFALQDLVLVMGLAIGLSALAGLYPAWRASRLDPIVALRKE
ncbi:MAG: ABC transporter permease [Candidatus Bathyarchaeia archaeon]